MSKTVKRVMTVMMIGLVAMLGANAEAHYIIVAGKLRRCDVCLTLDLRDVPDPFTAVVESEAEGISLEISCPLGPENQDVANVVGQQELPIPPTVKKNGKAEVVFRFHLDPSCSDRSQPSAVIIRAIASVEAKVCDGPDATNPCGDGTGIDTTVSTYTATDCELPATYNVDNLPPEGTRYKCDTQVIDHIL